jgi:hypothetical protein
MRPNLHILPYFGRTIKLAAPVLTPVSMLIAHTRYERGLCSANPAAPQPELPIGPTEADVAEYEANARVVMPPRRDWEDPAADPEPSRAHDHDWARLVSCVDPLDVNRPLLHASVYRPGMLSGCFSGTIVTPDLAGFHGVVHDPAFAPGSVQWAGRPLHIRLREHHAIDCVPVAVGLDELEWGDDVLNAWLPRSMHMVETGDELILDTRDDEGYAQRSRYATYHAGRSEPYSPYWTGVRQRMLDAIDEDAYVEEGEPEEDGTVEYVKRTPNFVKDIIITGETDGRHGDAWGHYTVVGRVRPWDGLVVLLRTPVCCVYRPTPKPCLTRSAVTDVRPGCWPRTLDLPRIYPRRQLRRPLAGGPVARHRQPSHIRGRIRPHPHPDRVVICSPNLPNTCTHALSAINVQRNRIIYH